MNYNLPWLIDLHEKHHRIKYLFFWGHQPSRGGQITASCFSQWWAGHSFEEAGITYLTAEHYMMAEKAKLFNDLDMWERIIEAVSPAEAKKSGRQVKNFDQKVWEKYRCDIVIKGNELKFSQHESLKNYLLGTNERVIVEASPIDKIWGIGRDKRSVGIEDPMNWKGLNLLGFCLMEVRDRLRGRMK